MEPFSLSLMRLNRLPHSPDSKNLDSLSSYSSFLSLMLFFPLFQQLPEDFLSLYMNISDKENCTMSHNALNVRAEHMKQLELYIYTLI